MNHDRLHHLLIGLGIFFVLLGVVFSVFMFAGTRDLSGGAGNTSLPTVTARVSGMQRVAAEPVASVPSAPNSVSKLHTFTIRITRDAFTPNTIIVNQDDVASISFYAADGDYEVRLPDYNMVQTIRNGEMKLLQFQAGKSGEFIFYCVSCGGPEKGPLGFLVVVPTK